MKIDLHLEITDDNGTRQSVALGAMDIEATPTIATLGLSLADGKAFLSIFPLPVTMNFSNTTKLFGSI